MKTNAGWSDIPGLRGLKRPAVGPFVVFQIAQKGEPQVSLLLLPDGLFSIIGAAPKVDDRVALALGRVACRHVRRAPPLEVAGGPAGANEERWISWGTERRLAKSCTVTGDQCSAQVYLLCDDEMPISTVRFSLRQPDDKLLTSVARQLLAWHA
ncbi:MAG TPA: hypothetical protein VG734_17450 [Lacunisphaera sp.]|nr:hypothetical protein [Lacunisphaera sp.]